MDQNLEGAVEQVFNQLIADTHSQNSAVADAAHSCITAMTHWKGRKLCEEEDRQAEIDHERYRI